MQGQRACKQRHMLWLAVAVMVGSATFGQSIGPSSATKPDEEAARRLTEQKERAYQEQRRREDESRAADEALMAQVRGKSICLAGTDTAFGSLKSLYSEFRAIHLDAPPNLLYSAGGDNVGIAEMIARRADAAVLREPLTEQQKNKLKAGFPDRELAEMAYSKAVLVIVVHQRNTVPSLTFQQIADIYRGKITDWSGVGGAGGKIEPVGTKYPALSWGMLTRQVLGGRPVVVGVKLSATRPSLDDLAKALDERAKTHPQGPYVQYAKDVSVIREVAKDPTAIGYCLLPPAEDALKGVRLVPIIGPADSKAVAPTLLNVFGDKYPLQCTVRFVVRPDASEITREFLAYACRREAEKTIQSVGLIPTSQGMRVLEDQRLADMRAGKGARLSTIGVDSARSPFQDLATEFVRAKEVVQLSYAAVDGDVSSVGAFITGDTGARELLVLGDRPSGRAMELHGEKWNALGVGKDGKPDGTGPAEYMIAGRAAAIIVNPANKLESLTLGQIQAIFRGDVDDWAVIGGTGLQPAGARPGTAVAPGGKLQINLVGLGANEPSSAVFEKEGVPRDKWRRVTVRASAAEAVAAVSVDPQAMAFVDLTAIPAGSQSVKVLPIKFGIGEKARNIAPTAENIKNAMYPLSQRYFLYVHPKASDTAKDFAKFVATCDGSEATPYADTVKAVMETYRKHGLIPLADEAITRAARDALAEAAAKAKAEAAAKAKGK